MKTQAKTLETARADAACEDTGLTRRKPAGRLPVTMKKIAFWYERWMQRQNLAELDDHILRDIGISPREVERECAKPFWRR